MEQRLVKVSLIKQNKVSVNIVEIILIRTQEYLSANKNIIIILSTKNLDEK